MCMQKKNLSEIACAHATSGMLSRNIYIYDYADPCCSNKMYLRCETLVIQLMLGPKLWSMLGKYPLNSPKKKKQLDRPKKLRKRSQIELYARVKMGRTGMRITCKRCGGVST